MEKKQELNWNEETNECYLLTKNEDGSILVEPLTLEEATLWETQNKF